MLVKKQFFVVVFLVYINGVFPELFDIYGLKQNPFTARSADKEDLNSENLFIQRQSAVLDSSKSSLVFGSRGSGKTALRRHYQFRASTSNSPLASQALQVDLCDAACWDRMIKEFMRRTGFKETPSNWISRILRPWSRKRSFQEHFRKHWSQQDLVDCIMSVSIANIIDGLLSSQAHSNLKVVTAVGEKEGRTSSSSSSKTSKEELIRAQLFLLCAIYSPTLSSRSLQALQSRILSLKQPSSSVLWVYKRSLLTIVKLACSLLLFQLLRLMIQTTIAGLRSQTIPAIISNILQRANVLAVGYATRFQTLLSVSKRARDYIKFVCQVVVNQLLVFLISSNLKFHPWIRRKLVQRMQSLSLEQSHSHAPYFSFQSQSISVFLVHFFLLYKALQIYSRKFSISTAGLHAVADAMIQSIRVLPTIPHDETNLSTKFQCRRDNSRRDLLILALKKVGTHFSDHKLAKEMVDDWISASPGEKLTILDRCARNMGWGRGISIWIDGIDGITSLADNDSQSIGWRTKLQNGGENFGEQEIWSSEDSLHHFCKSIMHKEILSACRVRSFFPGSRYDLGLEEDFLQGVARLDLFQVIDLSWSLAELIAMAERRWSHASRKTRPSSKLSPSLGFSPMVNRVNREQTSCTEKDSQANALRRFQHFIFGTSTGGGRGRDRDAYSGDSDSEALALACDDQEEEMRRQAILHLLNQIRTPREMLAVLDRSIICAASIHESKQAAVRWRVLGEDEQMKESPVLTPEILQHAIEWNARSGREGGQGMAMVNSICSREQEDKHGERESLEILCSPERKTTDESVSPRRATFHTP